MISLNLLPDVKKQFLKAQRIRNLIFTFSLISGAVAIGLVILGFVGVLSMNYRIDRNSDEITDLQEEYSGIDNLSKILTVRNQADSLPGLHDDKPVVSRLFRLLSITTPEEVDLSEVVIDFNETDIEITASTDAFNSVNEYVDTLKNTSFSSGEAKNQQAFSGIVSEQGVNNDQIRVTIVMSFESAIFDSANDVEFIVPDIETTQSERQKPLFNDQSGEEEGNDG
jgi:hypothetical protein